MALVAAVVLSGGWFVVREHRWREAQRREWTFDLDAARRQVRVGVRGAERLLAPARFDVTYERPAEWSMICNLGYDGFPYGFPWFRAVEGMQYLFSRREFVGRVDDPDAKAGLVAEYWRGLGYRVRVGKVGPPWESITPYVVHAETGLGGNLSFSAGWKQMNIWGDTPCALVEPANVPPG